MLRLKWKLLNSTSFCLLTKLIDLCLICAIEMFSLFFRFFYWFQLDTNFLVLSVNQLVQPHFRRLTFHLQFVMKFELVTNLPFYFQVFDRYQDFLDLNECHTNYN